LFLEFNSDNCLLLIKVLLYFIYVFLLLPFYVYNEHEWVDSSCLGIVNINQWIERWSLIVVIDSSQILSDGSKDEVLILEQVNLDNDCKTWK